MCWQKQVIKWKICVKLEIPTCGLWTGVRSLSSWLCGCRWTRFCDWACWAIAFSFSGYNWASRARIYHTWREDLCLDAHSDFKFEPELRCRTYLIFKHHPDWTLFLQLLPQLDHLPPQVLRLFLLQNIWWADAFILLLRAPPLWRGAT